MSLLDSIMQIIIPLLVLYCMFNFTDINYIPCSTVSYYPIGLKGINYFVLPMVAIFLFGIGLIIVSNGIKKSIIKMEMKK